MPATIYISQCEWRLAARSSSVRKEPVGSHMIRARRHLLSCRATDEGSSVFDADQEAMWFFDAAKEKRVQQARERAADLGNKGASTRAGQREASKSSSLFMQDASVVARGQRYLPHGGLGLCLVIFWAFFSTNKKLKQKEIQKRQEKVLSDKKSWLKSRTLLSMSPMQDQQKNFESSEYPDRITNEEVDSAGRSSGDQTAATNRRLSKKDYAQFLKESKAGDVLAPSESFGSDEKTSL